MMPLFEFPEHTPEIFGGLFYAYARAMTSYDEPWRTRAGNHRLNHRCFASADRKVSEQCGIAARKGNQLLGMIKINITYREKNVIIPLYKSIVRLHLEYCIQAWRPHLKKDIDKLERVQRRATKLIAELRILSYEDRVQQCKLTTLETRRVCGDQIEVFKITHGIEGLDSVFLI